MVKSVSGELLIDKYLEKISEAQRRELEKIRQIVLQNVPDVEEGIYYGIPGFRYKNQYLIGFASFKNHLSLFPTPEPIENLKEKLSNFKITKGTIQFTVENTIPEKIIKEIILKRLDRIRQS